MVKLLQLQGSSKGYRYASDKTLDRFTYLPPKIDLFFTSSKVFLIINFQKEKSNKTYLWSTVIFIKYNVVKKIPSNMAQFLYVRINV